MGLEPTTFAMARRRSSQLSYIRVAVSIEQAFRRGRDHSPSRTHSFLSVGADTSRDRWSPAVESAQLSSVGNGRGAEPILANRAAPGQVGCLHTGE